MNLEITYFQEPITLLGRFEPAPPMEIDHFEVRIDGKVCPPEIRDLIIMGMAHQAGVTGMTFSQVINEYLKSKGV